MTPADVPETTLFRCRRPLFEDGNPMLSATRPHSVIDEAAEGS